MSFNASSYFAGVGTVVVVMAIGFSAGMQMTGFFDDVQSPTKLDRHLAEQADAQRAADETKAKQEAMTGAAPSRAIAVNAPPAPASQAPKPAAEEARSEAPMATAQRIKETFAVQPRPSVASGSSQAAAPPQPLASQAPKAASEPALAGAPAPVQPQAASSAQPSVPDNYAHASGEDGTAVEKARAAAERKAAEQKKAQQRKFAAGHRQDRETRLNAAAEWLRSQPLDLDGPRFVRPPRYVAGDYFGR